MSHPRSVCLAVVSARLRLPCTQQLLPLGAREYRDLETLTMTGKTQLIVAGILSFIASILHISVIICGPAWYRYFGAGEGMAQLAESGSLQPAVVTSGIACVLAVWGFYALSGAGLVRKLPLLRLALCLITFVYLLRGVAGLILPFVSTHPAVTKNSFTFWMVSSIICCLYGLFYLLGTFNRWEDMRSAGTRD